MNDVFHSASSMLRRRFVEANPSGPTARMQEFIEVHWQWCIMFFQSWSTAAGSLVVLKLVSATKNLGTAASEWVAREVLARRVGAGAREDVHDPAASQTLATLAAEYVACAVRTLSQTAAGVAVLPGASLQCCQPFHELTQLVAHAPFVSALAVESLRLHG